MAIAFSIEVEPGLREENASNRNLNPGSDSIRTNLALVRAARMSTQCVTGLQISETPSADLMARGM
jgi:hypothetical protein